ncbi:MAG: elongation factor G [Proteobacteria bacterium]|nr:elongation factor G [Pseudomonadota bacterium]
MAKTLFDSSDIRNIALVGHGASGKTTLGEAILLKTGVTTRFGSTVAGTSTFDFEPEEVKRGGSNATAFAWCEYAGKKVNIIDTPGDGNFIYDSFTAMRGADLAVIVISAPDSVEVQTERAFHEACELGLAKMIVINKMDKERANPAQCLADIKEELEITPVQLHIPMGAAENFKGIVSVLDNKAYVFDGNSGKFKAQDIPAEYADAVQEAWEAIMEAVAETDDDLMMEYLDTMELSHEQCINAMPAAIQSGKLVPVLYTSALNLVGIEQFLDMVTKYGPNPSQRSEVAIIRGDKEEMLKGTADGPFAALVIRSFIDEFSGKQNIFRILSGKVPADNNATNVRTGDVERLGTLYALRGNNRDAIEQGVFGDIIAVAKLKDTKTNDTLAANADFKFKAIEYPAPMMSFNIVCKNKGEEDKLGVAVDKLIDEDPTLSKGYDDLGRALTLKGMGQQHLEMAIDKMKRKFKLEVTSSLPLVAYRETLKKRVQNIEGKHKKQSGGAGQFGVCYINASPLNRGEGFKFVDMIVGGAIPRQFIPAVEKGIVMRMESGPLAGYPVTDLQVELIDGKYHPVDSKEVAFQMAGRKAILACLAQGGVKLLEPVYKMDITIPTESVGDIMGDINSRRGRVLGMDPEHKKTVIHAICPLAEIQRYAPDLRAMTSGQGIFTMEFEGYEDVPANLEAKIVKESPFGGAKEEDDE